MSTKQTIRVLRVYIRPPSPCDTYKGSRVDRCQACWEKDGPPLEHAAGAFGRPLMGGGAFVVGSRDERDHIYLATLHLFGSLLETVVLGQPLKRNSIV